MTIVLQAQNFTINAVSGVLDSRTPTGVVGNRPPVIAAIPDIQVLAPAIVPLASYGSDPDGDALTWSRDGGNAPVGVTITPSGDLSIAAGSAPGTYTVSIKADDGRTVAADDWVARSTAAGVIWAHDFSDPREVDQFRTWQSSNRTVVGPNPADSHAGDGCCRWVSADSDTGRPCLELVIPTSPAPITVSGASNATVAIFTTALPHNLAVGAAVFFKTMAGGSWSTLNEYSGGAGGILNPLFVVTAVPTATTFTCRGSYNNSLFQGVPVDGTGLGAYTANSGSMTENKSSDAGWLRPFTPLSATPSGSTVGNGKTTPDPAANGTIPLRTTWDASSLNCNYNWRDGYFCHSSYAAAADVWQGGSGKVLGTETTGFWLQFRVKLSAGRFNPVNNSLYGKLLFVGVTADTPTHEIVVRSQAKPVDYNSINDGGAIFSMYTGQGLDYRLVNPFRAAGSNGQGALQPGGAYDPPPSGQCFLSNSSGALNCWEWPSNEWVVVLMHVIPGVHNVKNTGVQVWVARQSQLANGYVKIHDKLDYDFLYGDNYHPNAWNAFLPTAYMNSQATTVGFTHRFDQIILSKNFIPCPAS